MNDPTKEVADLSEIDRARIDAAWERHKRAGEPNWPPRMSAADLREGSLARGSTGQTWEVRNGQWARIFL
jgi:hypothetical protein